MTTAGGDGGTVARALVSSLLQRFVADGHGNFVLQGPITPAEFNALRSLLGDGAAASEANE